MFPAAHPTDLRHPAIFPGHAGDGQSACNS
jgi:hypothetical protein